jgi:hypothetical protein
MLKCYLTGKNMFYGDEFFLKFGRELHKRFLEPHRKKEKFDPENEKHLEGMLKSLRSHPIVKFLTKDAKFEQRSRKKINGQYIKVILDIDKDETTGADVKTTSARTYHEFLQSMKKYDYGRQGKLYSKAKNKKVFVFIGIQKKPPYQVYIVNMKDYKHLMDEGWLEAQLLIDVFKSLKAYYDYYVPTV